MATDWRAKVEALLNKAHASGTTVEESQSLQEKAAYLMAKFGIEEAAFRQKNRQSSLKPASEKYQMFPPYANRKLDLIIMVAQHLDGATVRGSNVREPVVVFAYPEDLARIKMLYHSLLAQMHIEQALVIVPKGNNAKSYKNAWLLGFVVGVREALERAKRQAMQEFPGSSLIIRKSHEEIMLVMQDTFPGIKTGKRDLSINDEVGFSAGRATGQRADIGQGRLTSQNVKAIK